MSSEHIQAGRFLGEFRELRHGRPDGPSLYASVRSKADPYEADLVRYLRGGSVLAASGSAVHDVLSSTNELIDGLHLLTDGEWFWYTDLAHYVERYHVPLDDRFCRPRPPPEMVATGTERGRNDRDRGCLPRRGRGLRAENGSTKGVGHVRRSPLSADVKALVRPGSGNWGRDRDWSFRCADPEGGFNPYGWNSGDQEQFASAWTAEGDDLVDALIETYGVMWPWVCPRRLLTRLPAVAEGLHALARERLIGQGHTYRDRPDSLYEHVAMYGPFHAARERRSWPDAAPQTCPLCEADFTAGRLNPWMIRQFGPARWCKECCLRARDGRAGNGTAGVARQALVTLSASLGATPPQDFAQRPVPLDLPADQRDAIVKAMAECPPAAAIRSALGVGSWIEVLRSTGIVHDAWRPARGTYCVAADGHPCRSLAEQAVDDWLSRHGVEHETEPLWPRHTDYNRHGRLRADWRLSDGTYVEYAGLTGEEYLAKIRAKQLLARHTGIDLVVITPPDLADLTELLGSWAT